MSINITNSDDWLELGDGELGTVIGRVNSIGPSHVSICFSDWSLLYIDIEDGPLRAQPFPTEVRIKLHVERTEDGVMTTQTMLEAAEIFS